ncbi:MAG: hypothetical protein WCP32_13985 [Bacteroidota bacterium]
MKPGIQICIILVSITCSGWAAGERNPAGGRAAGMGGTSVALIDFWSLSNNEAGLAWLKTGAAGFSFENRFLLADITTEVVGIAIPLKVGTFGLSVNRYGNNLYNELKGGLVFARKFGARFGAGLQFNYQRFHLAGEYGNRKIISFQIGLIYQPDKRISVGVQIINPVPVKITENPAEYLPASINLGLTWQLSDEFLATIEVGKELQNLPVFRAGAEYHFAKPLFVRIGISTNPMSFTFGFGIETGKLKFDFSSGYHQQLGFSPSASVVYTFKR